MEVTYELTQQDFVESIIAHRDRTFFRKWGLRAVVYAMLLFGGAGLAFLVVRPTSQVLSNFGPLCILAGLWAAFYWGGPRLAARKQFAGQPSVRGQRTMRTDESGLRWQWDSGSVDCDWSNFFAWRESPSLFLLYFSPVVVQMVPKRSMTAERLSEFRELLSRRIPHR